MIHARHRSGKEQSFLPNEMKEGSELIESRGGKKTHPIIMRLLMLILPTESQNVGEGEQKQKPFVGFSLIFQRG